jgi:phosphoenolpyruvate carboxylase
MKKLKRQSSRQNLEIAKSFTLMLEVMNVCENAYRSIEIRKRGRLKINGRPESVVYVLTAHPTEARTPGNIWIFHAILKQLIEVLERKEQAFTELDRRRLRHNLEIAWRISLVRRRKPRVQDEAEHIYSTLLRDETLRTILAAEDELAPIFIRSWVGGDKDGHPGVNEKVFMDSLGLSRLKILEFSHRRLVEVRQTLHEGGSEDLLKHLSRCEERIRRVRHVKAGDSLRVSGLKKTWLAFLGAYEKEIGDLHPSLIELRQLLCIFPGLVVPLEFRESSDILLSQPSGRGLAIDRMLKALNAISRGGDPRDYVRGFIVSMTSELKHLELAAGLVKKNLGQLKLPVIPLFEQAGALDKSSLIVEGMLRNPAMRSALKRYWRGQLEIMLGYSDSSKESGVLPSRLKVAETMHRLDRLCTRKRVVPVFFQGSGGSTDRGGGSVSEQTAWWSASALRNYKVTIQGEMVERSLADPDITRGQLERIVQSAGGWKQARHRRLKPVAVLDRFATQVAEKYETTIQDPEFLQLIQHATPYPYLDLLRFGSRPSKRSKKVSLAGLRAIPWILCWTQTRVLFPTWWGVGQAWSQTSALDKKKLIRLASRHPAFATYVRALGYTLAKVDLAVWHLYIEESALSRELKNKLWTDCIEENRRALLFARAVLGGSKLISWRPWLQESISLRTPMIHPLNLLQIIAMQKHDATLLRTTVAGISSGMMTTG